MSSTLIGWLFTIGFIVILAVGFLIGMWRGLKRSTVNLIISVIAAVIAFFITPLITDAVLGLKLVVDGENSTLKQILVELLRNDKDINAMMIANKNLEVFFSNLPSALVNVVAFIVVTAILQLVFYIIFKILAMTVFRIKEDEKKRSLLGGVVGLIKTCIVVMFAFMPLAGLTGMANNLLKTDNYGFKTTQTSFVEEKLPKNVENVIVGAENNMLIKMCGIFGLDNAMFDYYSTFEIDGEELTVREEVDEVYKVADFSYQISKADLNELDYVHLRYDKILKAVKQATESTLFKKVVADTAAELIINHAKYSFMDLEIFKEYPDVFENINAELTEYVQRGRAYQFFQNDILETINSVKILGQSGIINDVLDLNDATIEEVANVITSDDNEKALSNALNRICNVKVVRHGLVTIADKALTKVSTELDKIDVSTKDWKEEDWDEFKTSIFNVVNNFGDVAGEVDLFRVIEKPTILLDKTENYNIDLISSKIGLLLDNIRSNRLLKNSEGKPIIDKLLDKHNLEIPENQVHSHVGDYLTTIDNYQEYFAFIKDSLLKLRDKDVYEIINNNTISANEKIQRLANIISMEGNENLLSDIILPLYQVEPTKTLIIDELSSSLQSQLVDFASLSTYEDWKKDLKYISSMITVLNGLSNDSSSLLTLALNGDMNSVLETMTEENVEEVLKPILYAKSTSGIREKLFASIKTQLDDASGADSVISLQNVTFAEDNEEDQADEVIEIVKKLIDVDNAIEEGESLKTMNKLTLGSLLNTMRDNAYRKELAEKQQEGVFASAFVDLVDAFKQQYEEEIEYIETEPSILDELGVNNLSQENYKNINYIQLLNKIESIQNQI